MTEKEREAKFHSWIQDHLGLILKVVRSYAALAADQEDLLQEVFVNLWSSIPNFQGRSKDTTWIYRVAIQSAMVWRRGEARRRRFQATLKNKFSIPRLSNECQVADHEMIEKLYSAIRQLSKVDASIAIMHLDGLSYREISDIVGISENYIGVKLTRIRKHISDQFQCNDE